MRPKTRPGRWALTALLVIVVAGCGVSSQQSATPLPAGQVPFGLSSLVPSDAGTNGGQIAEAVILYLLNGDHLVPVARELPAPASMNARLRALASGPTSEEAAAGLSSAVSAPGSAFTGTVDGSKAIVSLPSGFPQLAAGDQVDALAQLVYTATAIPGVGTVSFLVDDKPVAVPRANSTTTSRPVTRADYEALAPVVSS